MRSEIVFYLNGELHRVSAREAFLTLSDYLRETRGLVGTKIVCSEGDCGACSVLIGRPRGNRIEYAAVDACIQFVYQVDATHVVTVEGLRGREGLHPVQEAMVACHGSQCGYCTPGFVVTMAGMFENGKSERMERLCEEELREGLSGNLCRCTGYVQIVEAGCAVDPARVPRVSEIYPDKQLATDLAALAKEEVRVEGRDAEGHHLIAYLPRDWKSAATFKGESRETVVVSGATDIGVQRNKGRIAPRRILCLARIDGDDDARREGRKLSLGARAPWSVIDHAIESLVPDYHKVLLRFGGPQIRNAGTVGGNLVNASPIADSIPFHFVTQTELELVGKDGTRRVPIEKFYLGYKKLDLKPDELLKRVTATLPDNGEVLRLYKISKRKNLDISTFTAAILARIEGDRVHSTRIAYGGVGPVVLRLPRTEGFLAGKPYSEETFREAGRIARGEITPISDVRGRADYRSQLAENILVRFFHDAATECATAPV